VAVDWERDEIPAWQWIDAPNREGDTALHVAAAKGFLFAVTKLLQDGLVDIVNMMSTYAIIYSFIHSFIHTHHIYIYIYIRLFIIIIFISLFLFF